MSVGLIALLDDVVGLAKVAAASLDDVTAQAAKAGTKAAGIVIDDAAVTPRYVVGFAAERELPVVGKIAVGSLRNKLIFLLPAALVLSLLAPWAITPLLMAGGAYLCFEGAEKVLESVMPGHGLDHGQDHGPAGAGATSRPDAKAVEDDKVRSAISTDFILSAEIMAITLSTVPSSSFWVQAAVLAAVGVGITALVYGGVALIVKADDAGMALACNTHPVSSLLGARAAGIGDPGGADRFVAPVTRALGRGLVIGMPYFLKALAVVGTAAMLWVGGGIILHGLEQYGFAALAHWIHAAASSIGSAFPAIGAAAEWIVSAVASGLFGLLVGGALIPVVQYAILPLAKRLRGPVAEGDADAKRNERADRAENVS